MPADQIQYSEKYFDDKFEYRYLINWVKAYVQLIITYLFVHLQACYSAPRSSQACAQIALDDGD